MTFETFQKIFDYYQKPELTKVRFSGGEPFLNPSLLRMVQYAQNYVFDVAVVTNGALLERNIDGILQRQLRELTVSLHSAIPATFSYITGFKEKTFRSVTTAIDTLTKNGVQVKLNAVLVRGVNTTSSELGAIIEYSKAHGIVRVDFIELDTGSLRHFPEQKYHISPKTVMEKLMRLGGHFAELDRSQNTWIGEVNALAVNLHMAHCYNQLCGSCIVWRPILVLPNGEISRCRLGMSMSQIQRIIADREELEVALQV